MREVHFYGPKRPPTWVGKLKLETKFVFHTSGRLFNARTPTASERRASQTPERICSVTASFNNNGANGIGR
jgi:hypothetical protein